MSSSLRETRVIPTSDPCAPLLLLHNHQQGTEGRAERTPSIYTYSAIQSPAPSSTNTLSPCLKFASSPLLPSSPRINNHNHNKQTPAPKSPRSPRFSDTPEYIPRTHSPSWEAGKAAGGSLQVRYPGLARASAPSILPVPPPLDAEVEMPDLITFSPPVGSPGPGPVRLSTGSPPPCYAPTAVRAGAVSPMKGDGVMRRPSFKINIPRCPNPSDLAAQVGRATGTGPAPRTYTRTPYPDEEGVDYLSRALDRVEVKCCRSSSGDACSPPRSETPGTLSPPSDSSEAGRSSMDSSNGRSLPVVEVAIQDAPSAGIQWTDPWNGTSKTMGRRGRQMTKVGGRPRGGRRHPADMSDEGSDADEESAGEDEEEGEEEEHLLREQLGSPCLSPHSHKQEAEIGFPAMLARVGRRLSGQGKPATAAPEEER